MPRTIFICKGSCCKWTLQSILHDPHPFWRVCWVCSVIFSFHGQEECGSPDKGQTEATQALLMLDVLAECYKHALLAGSLQSWKGLKAHLGLSFLANFVIANLVVLLFLHQLWVWRGCVFSLKKHILMCWGCRFDEDCYITSDTAAPEDQKWLAQGWSQKEIDQWKEKKKEKNRRKKDRSKENQWVQWENENMQKHDTLQPWVLVPMPPAEVQDDRWEEFGTLTDSREPLSLWTPWCVALSLLHSFFFLIQVASLHGTGIFLHDT